MTTPCRLIVDPPADGPWNMAVDEALLDGAAEADVPTLRVYQWQRPTLSLGYFQRAADRAQHLASLEADLVRRLSGGGAIVHDREVTYSLVLPRSHPLASQTQLLYQAVHEAILRFLASRLPKQNSKSRLSACTTTSSRQSREEPFLCFQRHCLGDILWQSADDGLPAIEHKIVGSAQRRRHGAVLQHGSILLGRSTMAPELPGFRDLSSVDLTPEDAITNLPPQIAGALQLELQPPSPSDHDRLGIEALYRRKYACRSWSERR